jgi:hypothetical protein
VKNERWVVNSPYSNCFNCASPISDIRVIRGELTMPLALLSGAKGRHEGDYYACNERIMEEQPGRG